MSSRTNLCVPTPVPIPIPGVVSVSVPVQLPCPFLYLTCPHFVLVLDLVANSVFMYYCGRAI